MGDKMHGIEYGTGYIHCSFCFERGHNITSCPHVAEAYEAADYKILAHYPDGTPLPDDCHPWTKVSNWPSLCSKSQKAFIEMENRRIRASKRKLPTSKRKKPRCSFCRKEGHRRPNCKSKKKFTKTVYKANSVWRKCFMDHVNHLGVGIGALVRVPTSMFYWNAGDRGDSILCMITDYSFEKMHVFCAHKHRDDWRTSPDITVTDTLSGSEYKLPLDRLATFTGTPLVNSNLWGHNHTIDVVSPVEWSPSEQWLNAKYNKELEYLIDKISIDDGTFRNVNKLINAWNIGEDNEQDS